jgi:hypothetical protein
VHARPSPRRISRQLAEPPSSVGQAMAMDPTDSILAYHLLLPLSAKQLQDYSPLAGSPNTAAMILGGMAIHALRSGYVSASVRVCWRWCSFISWMMKWISILYTLYSRQPWRSLVILPTSTSPRTWYVPDGPLGHSNASTTAYVNVG